MKTAVACLVVALLATGASRATVSDFRVTLSGDDRMPAAGEPWRFVVRSTDAAGHPVAGTAIVRVLVAGRTFDTVGWFGFNGVLRRTYRWSRALGGAKALLQVTVTGPEGKRTAGYAVRVVADSGKPRFRATLLGDDPKPRAGVPWRFALRAFDGAGNPVGGTAILRVVANGRIVDTLGWFRFDGLLRQTYRWPSALRGSSALLQATVVGPGGTRAAADAVLVR